MVDDAKLAEIEARANAASDGPWYYDGRDIFSEGFQGGGHRIVVPLPETWHESQRVPDADAEFIAHAREDVPALLARVHELEAEREIDVELVAEALYERAMSVPSFDQTPRPTNWRDDWRAEARTVLSRAARGVSSAASGEERHG